MLFLTGCNGQVSDRANEGANEGANEVFNVDEASIGEKIEELRAWGQGGNTRLIFWVNPEPAFKIQSFSESWFGIGECSDFDVTIGFEIEVLSKWPMENKIRWAIVTEDGTLYTDDFYLNSVQPKSRQMFFPYVEQIEECATFSPVAFYFYMSDTDYFYEAFYGVKKVPDPANPGYWQFHLKNAEPYAVEAQKPYFDVS